MADTYFQDDIEDGDIVEVDTKWGFVFLDNQDSKGVLLLFGNDGSDNDKDKFFFWKGAVSIECKNLTERDLNFQKAQTAIEFSLARGDIEGKTGIEVQTGIIDALRKQGLTVDSSGIDMYFREN